MYRNTVSHTLLSYLLNIFKEFFKNHSSGHQCYFFRFGLLPFPKISKITNYIMYGNYQFDYHISSIKIVLLHISEYIWPCTKQSIDQSFFFVSLRPKSIGTPAHHIHISALFKLLPQSWKHTINE